MVMKKSKKSKKEHRKKKIKASLVAKTSEMLSSPSMQKLLLSAMLRSMNKSPPSPDISSSDSSDWGPLSSPANLPEAIPRTFPASTFLDNGLVKLRFDRLASPFQVRNQIVERSLHKEISFDIQKIKDQATNIRPCIPFQNLSCHRIVPVHGSMSTDLVFSHVCLLCLFSEGLPLPHAMVHCPFSSTLEPPNNN